MTHLKYITAGIFAISLVYFYALIVMSYNVSVEQCIIKQYGKICTIELPNNKHCTGNVFREFYCENNKDYQFIPCYVKRQKLMNECNLYPTLDEYKDSMMLDINFFSLS